MGTGHERRPDPHNRAMTSQVGTLLNGRYRLDAQIGHGGMSTVYRAFDTVLERQVAIKLMHREIAVGLRPARALPPRGARRRAAQPPARRRRHRRRRGRARPRPRRLSTPYIVFEYVEGETLKDRIRRHGRLPIGESVAYAIEIARALGAAHDHRIVHRDVKPQNVLIDEEGTAKVTDFGIARSLDRGGAHGRRPRAGHDRLRLARAGAGPGRRPARATSTRWASSSSRCSRATSRSTARTRSPWR